MEKLLLILFIITLILFVSAVIDFFSSSGDNYRLVTSLLESQVISLYRFGSFDYISKNVTDGDLTKVENENISGDGEDIKELKMRLIAARRMFDVEQKFKNELESRDFFLEGVDLQNIRKELELLQESNPRFVASMTEIIIVTLKINDLYNEDGTLKKDVTLERIIESKTALKQITEHEKLRNELNLKVVMALSLLNM